jgi:polyisoprenoid-binding protein YceI
MRILVLIFICALALGVQPATKVVAQDAAVPANAWQIDPVHSSIVWRISHNNGAGIVYGRFDSFAGMIIADPADPASSRVQVTVDAASINSVVAKRDEDLRSEAYFNTASFPSISFVSTSVTSADGEENAYEVTGDLTLLGVTRPLTVVVRQLAVAQDMKGNPVTGFETSFKIKRSDFGMATGIPAIGDEVELMLAFECKAAAATAQAGG